MTLEARIEKLEKMAGAGEADADDACFVHGNKTLKMSAEQWQRFERRHPGEYITVLEHVEMGEAEAPPSFECIDCAELTDEEIDKLFVGAEGPR